MFYSAQIARADRKIDRTSDWGPFDIIGDIHGCFDELVALLQKLGYSILKSPNYISTKNPEGRKVIFAGDLVDRGPKSIEVLQLVMTMEKEGKGLCIPGNHDEKLMRYLMGRKIQVNEGMKLTVDALRMMPPEFNKQVKDFLFSLPTYYMLDRGNLLVTHAGLKEEFHGQASKEIREYCLYGEASGDYDKRGFPIHINWAKEYSGKPLIVYGHTPVYKPYWCNNTVDIDTGCIFGGELTALRYPERELVSVEAVKEYVSGEGVFGI